MYTVWRYCSKVLYFVRLAMGFEDPPPDFPVAEELVAGWMCLQAMHVFYIACALLSMRPATPFQPPAHTCSTPCTTDAEMLRCYGDAVVPLPRPCVSRLSFTTSGDDPLLLFALTMPRRLAAANDALLGIV
jgi:hypothetical protein